PDKRRYRCGCEVSGYATYQELTPRIESLCVPSHLHCLVAVHADCFTAGSSRFTRSRGAASSFKISQPVNTTISFSSGKTISFWPPNPHASQTNFPCSGYNHHLNPYWKSSPVP